MPAYHLLRVCFIGVHVYKSDIPCDALLIVVSFLIVDWFCLCADVRSYEGGQDKK